MGCLPQFKDTNKMTRDEFKEWHKEIYRPYVEKQRAMVKRFADKMYKPKKRGK